MKSTKKTKKTKLIDRENRVVVGSPLGDSGVSKMSEGDQKVQTPSCEINRLWRCGVHRSDYSQLYCSVYLKVAGRVYLENSHHKKKFL